jgi:hypothetical protein
MPSAPWREAACVIGAAFVASCADVPSLSPALDAVSSRSAAAGKADVCHKPDDGGQILGVGLPALGGHLAHGDYVSTLLVSHEAGPSNDGVHFATIGAALASAAASRAAVGETVAAACRITIVVSAGTYQGTVGTPSGTLEHFPMIVDVPDVTLRGALVMALDAAGRATGESTTGEETVLAPVEPLPFVDLLSTPIIIANAHPGGSAGNGLVVEGFVFQSGHPPLTAPGGGQAVLTLRATGVTIRGNRVEGGFTESFDLRAGSAEVIENHLSGTAGTCDVCLAGPGTYSARGNRLLAGGIPGIGATPIVNIVLPPGIEPYVLPATSEVWVDIRNNEVRDHQRTPVGVGIRMDAVGLGAPNVYGSVHAVVRDNLLVNNRFGMIVHAAFPVTNTLRRGDVEMTLGGNVFQETCQARLYVAFSRHTFGLGLPTNSVRLQSSTFRLTLNGDVSWDDAWFYHPAGFGNTLVVDGNVIANGTRHFWDLLGCPAS